MHSESRNTGKRPLFIRISAAALLLATAGVCVVAADNKGKVEISTPMTQPASRPATGAWPLDPRPFDRQAAGISFLSPLGWNGMVQADRDELIRYTNDLKKQDWTLSVTRRSFPKPQNLFAVKAPKDPKNKDAKDEFIPGIVENTLEALKKELPGAKVLRAGDPSNIGASNVGMIVLRYTKNGERRLAQHAILEANNQLYYLIAFNSPGRKDVTEDDNAEEKTVDPTELQAVETFRNILDTVKLLDLQPVRDDQVQRLFHTRAIINSFKEKKLNDTLIAERYLRIVKEGRDIGYSYVKEEPRRQGGSDGIYVGIHTRLMTLKDGKVYMFPREDSETQSFTAMDRHNENWTKISVWDEDGQKKTIKNPWKKVSEFGASARTSQRVAAVPKKKEFDPLESIQVGDNNDPKQPWVNYVDKYVLNVQFKGTRGDLEPVIRPLPPFYVPQAIGSLLPRLLPAREPKQYLFATYVSDLRQVALRYIDVRPEEDLPNELVLATGLTRGVPIDDRIGFEGMITTHYVTIKGDYLGSYTRATKLFVIPSDKQTLVSLWRLKDEKELFVLPPSEEPVITPPATPAGPPGAATINQNGPGGGLPRNVNR
jgi:hypothetical protein